MKTIEIVYYNNETPQFAERSEFQEIPETWEELVELCKRYEDIEIWNGIIRIAREDRGNIEIYSLDGTIACNEYLLAEDRTIPQIWEIIKNLMEDK